jgi:asparaginyl-tRNA synthetase
MKIYDPANEFKCRLTTGACVELQGSLIASPGKEQSKELQVKQVKVLGECDSVNI